MNHSALKKFAIKARKDLIEQVGAKLKYALSSDSAEQRERQTQINDLKAAISKEGEALLIERVAYIWFNRLAALRFMDAQNCHPFACRAVTPVPGNSIPEILQVAREGQLPDSVRIDANRINGLLDGRIPSADPQAECYRILIVGVCNFYHQLMPYVFEKIEDYTELLLPDDLLSEASVADGFRSIISDDDCSDVELIGWLYQYYSSDKKDQVMARQKAVPKEDIPAVTQLFTPHWIVQYKVENSLGRLWLQSRSSSGLKEQMRYYIEPPEDADQTDCLKVSSPEEIKLIDPACGSGHILTYAFDLLYAIYEEEGYDPSSIPGLILSKNLFGVEIDERAAELAYFALVMKAQQRSSRFLRRQLRSSQAVIAPNICCLEEIHFEEGELRSYMDALDIGSLFTAPVLTLMHQFEDAKNLGSLIQPALDDVSFLREAINGKDFGGDLFLRETHLKVLHVLEQAEMLGQRYHCAVANPPYLGGKGMNTALANYAKKVYPDSKSDLFAAFIERNHQLLLRGGVNAMITMQSWMFLSSYEKLRAKLLKECLLSTMVHLGPRAFDTIGGEVVQATAFTFEKSASEKRQGIFFRIVDGKSEKEKMESYVSKLAGYKRSLSTAHA